MAISELHKDKINVQRSYFSNSFIIQNKLDSLFNLNHHIKLYGKNQVSPGRFIHNARFWRNVPLAKNEPFSDHLPRCSWFDSLLRGLRSFGVFTFGPKVMRTMLRALKRTKCENSLMHTSEFLTKTLAEIFVHHLHILNHSLVHQLILSLQESKTEAWSIALHTTIKMLKTC